MKHVISFMLDSHEDAQKVFDACPAGASYAYKKLDENISRGDLDIEAQDAYQSLFMKHRRDQKVLRHSAEILRLK